MTFFVQASDITDADTVSVMIAAMGTDTGEGTTGRNGAVLFHNYMITAIYKASMQVPPLDVSNGEMLILTRGETVKDDEGNGAFGLFVT